MFMGEYNHTVDEKGRLIIPSKLRDGLGSEFVITKGLDGCLFAYENTEWKAFEEKLQKLPLTSKDSRTFVRFMLGGAQSVELDKQGRVLLPQPLRNFAGIDKDVTLVGMANRVEIWSKDKYEEVASVDNMDEIAANMEALGI